MRCGLKPRMHSIAPAPPLAGVRGGPRPGRGFTYIGLLIFIALMGIALAGTGTLWHTHAQREKERELLFVGDQFRQAIGRYYELSPGGDKRFPATLEDLLLDERYPVTQRYLRRVYADPVTGKAQWGIVTGPGERIAGVYSLSDAAPFKRAGFPAVYEDFEDKEHYREWRFVYIPPAP
jgi:type II secretory pathway pseudopilin PulG